MQKLIASIIFTMLVVANSLSFGATLNSMNQDQLETAIVNKTFISIATDNLNGRTIDNTFSMFLDDHGNIFGEMAYKPKNEPQTDSGVYSIADDGTFYITWQHWDGAKKLCGHLFNAENAYISIDCAHVFHTVFMKDTIRSGNQLK